MAFILSDRVKETTTTTGTGTVTLGGTIDASKTFSAAIGDGNSTYYCIESPDGNFEVGIGTYTSSSNTLSRDTVISSTNGGSKISLVGVSNVFCTQPGPKAVFINSVGLVSGVNSSFEGFAFPDGTIQYTSATSGNAPTTMQRQNEGILFNYFVNNAYDETVSLHLENEQFPRFKLGLRDSPDGNSAPTYGYLFGEQGYAGGVADSTSEFFIANNNGFWIKHASQNIANFAQDDGIVFQNVSAASPAFTVKGNAAQAADLQRWSDNASTTLAKVTKEGHISGVQIHTPHILFADGTTQVSAAAVASGDNISIFANDAGYLTSHPSISAASSSNNSNNVFIQDITLDSNGHVTAIGTASAFEDWNINSDDGVPYAITDGNTLQIAGGTNVTTTYNNSTKVLTVNATDTNTTYTAGDGLTLSGTEFSAPDIATASGALRTTITSNTAAIPASGYTISGVLQPQISSNTTAIPASGYVISGVLQPQITSNVSNISTNTIAIPASGYHISGVLQSQIDGLSVGSDSFTSESGVAHSGFFSEELHNISGVGGLIANKSNWDTAYSWGDHSTAGYLTSETSHADVVVDGDFGSEGLMKRGASGGSYSIVTDNSSNWNTAYGWGDHSTAGYLTSESDSLQTVTSRGSHTSNSITSSGDIFASGNITATSGIIDVLDMTPLVEANYPTHQEGVIFYDSDNHTLSLYNDEADVTLQLGQEEFLRVRNNTGDIILNGSGVKITGAHGNTAPTIAYAQADTEDNSQVVGLATHDIENDSFGYVTTYGIVRGVNTSSFSAGDELFLSASNQGTLVNTSPTIPNYKVSVGHVIRNHSNGSILVQVGNPKLGGGDLKSEAAVALSGVPFVTSSADTNAGGMQTNSNFIYDSGNNQLQLGSGIQLLNAVPGNTTNVLYNDGGTLKFNGSAVDTNTTYTAGSGIELQGTEFNVAISGDNILATNSPVDNYIPSYDSATGKFTWVENTGGGGGGSMSNFIITDGSTPQTIDDGETITFADGTGAEFVTSATNTVTVNSVDSEIDHNSLNNYVANQHIDWTIDQGSTNIHAGNYTDTNTQLTQEQVEDYIDGLLTAGSNISLTYDDAAGTLTVAATDTNTMGSGFTVSATTDSNATTITEGDDLFFAAGTGITCETTADGTVTISCTVTDTNTQLSQEQVEDYVDGLLTAGSNVSLTYDDAAGTLTIASTDTNTQLTQEQVEDYVNGLLTAGSNVSLTYDDAAGTLTVAATDTNTMGSGFTVSATTDSNATTITQGDDLMFAAGTGITCETTADGTVTISCTVTDTNTQLSQEQVEDYVDGLLTAGSNVSLTYDDAAGTLTIASTDTNTMGSGFTVSATTDSNATTITQGDDLMFAAGTGITCETTADGTVTISCTVTDTNTQLSQEQVEDYVDGLLTAGSNISLTYDDAAGTLTIASAHPNISAASTSNNSGRTYIQDITLDSNGHVTGIATATETVTDTNTMGSGFTVSATTDTNATTITEGDDLFFAAGTGITCETTADGTVTISCTVTDTNTQLSQEQVEDYVDGLLTAGSNVSLTYDDAAGTLTIASAHPNISAASTSNNSGRTYIQDITLDSNGHVTGIATATETVTDTNTMGSGFTVSATTDTTATTITEGDDLFFAAGTGITCETTADGTVTISCTVTDTNTQLSEEQVEDFVGGMVTGNTETGISVTYEDSDGTLDFVVSDTTVAGDSGSTGITPGDTLTIAGGTNATTAMSGDTLTVNVDDAFLKNDADDTTTGTVTMANLIVGDGGNIGSASDTDAISISSAGAVTFSKSINQAPNTATDGGAIDIDCGTSNYHEITLNANASSIVFTNVTAGQRIIVRFKQHTSHVDLDSNNGFDTVTVNGGAATVTWPGGTIPTLTETNDAVDVYGFLFQDTVTNVHAFIIGQNLS